MMNRHITPTETILLVEDHPCLCEVLATVLRRCGYRVLTATNGEQACRHAHEAGAIDLLLGPVELPEMSREELATWFRPAQPHAKIAWMTSGHHTIGSGESLPVIEKPYIYLDAFIREVRAVLKSKPASHKPALAA